MIELDSNSNRDVRVEFEFLCSSSSRVRVYVFEFEVSSSLYDRVRVEFNLIKFDSKTRSCVRDWYMSTYTSTRKDFSTLSSIKK
jgi:hypothetical protein